MIIPDLLSTMQQKLTFIPQNRDNCELFDRVVNLNLAIFARVRPAFLPCSFATVGIGGLPL
jgi:hypothetical protein